MSDKMYVAGGLQAAILRAEVETPRIRPGGKTINPCPKLYWDRATDEEKQDKSIIWLECSPSLKFGTGKFTYRPFTNEEKEEIRLNTKWRLENMFYFILEHYGMKRAVEFYRRDDWNKKFIKCGAKPNLYLPYCKYDDGQCDMECQWFRGCCGCAYFKEDRDGEDI